MLRRFRLEALKMTVKEYLHFLHVAIGKEWAFVVTRKTCGGGGRSKDRQIMVL